ncbi:MAG: DNA-directed RNA polymerase subunit beta' [Firmicutes bacterium]|nr:DNA-directed RNA polymerase subunit beta' [Bacillota bacterium]
MDSSDFDAIRISLASPEKIREWSFGEVRKPETINYRTLKPEKDGLFCEKIFGPTKDWECHCGKYKKVKYEGIICDRCGVEITKSKVRRERMGHIEFAAPVSSIWYFKGIPSRMGLLLDLSPKNIEKVLYFSSYIVTDEGDTPLTRKQILSDSEFRENRDKFGYDFTADMGAQAIKTLLQQIDIVELSTQLKEELLVASGQKKMKLLRRLEVVEDFRKSGNKPEWMILDVLPVIPPELRPMVQLDGGRFATSDLNDLYRRVINRNNRLKKLIQLIAPEIIIKNEKRMLQEAVDALIDNGRRGRPVSGSGNRPLKSLSDMLKGKQGRFRQNLLGKRVDYSGRSVIVVGPELEMHQCGLPRKMALELFKPFVMKCLVEKAYALNIKQAKKLVEREDERVWDILEDVVRDHPVLLNRAPTLHRLGIQAFEPMLVDGKAIKLHPLVCTAYNADFDGDQMAVHVPLSIEAQAEARLLMMSVHNILNPKDGFPVATPTQDMVLGSYYLTIEKPGAKGEGMIFASYDEAMMAYEHEVVTLHARVKVRDNGKILDTTLGRLIFNKEIPIPEELGYYNETMDKKKLALMVYDCHRKLGSQRTANLLDGVKRLGYKYSTKAGLTVAVSDINIPEAKQGILDAADAEVEKIENLYKSGFCTVEERHEKVVSLWSTATNDVTKAMMNNLDEFNPIFMMATSGARGNLQQIRQLAGMRGLMTDPSGKIVDLPIKANFREGLTVLEYFLSTHGARKGLADTALRTADSGYLTRRLVDVSQDVIIREDDCGDTDGFEVESIIEGTRVIEPLKERITGRYAADNIVHPETGEVIVGIGEFIDEDKAEEVVTAGIKVVKIRSAFNCKTRQGICAKCYGRNLATGGAVEKGEAVGTIAAQSIGEPGTQLTMRTFHTGGVAGDDITQGLPRIEELFEARKPKGKGELAPISGVISIEYGKGKILIKISNEDTTSDIQVANTAKMRVENGDIVQKGDLMTDGPLDPHVLLDFRGIKAVQNYILREVQKVYRTQGVDINDKHIEIIIRQMLKKYRVKNSGDTNLLESTMIDIFALEENNEDVNAKAEVNPILLGITQASLATESFLSAASFQETTKVLTDAAIKGKYDRLVGLKENVQIGKLIPTGTGFVKYNLLEVKKIGDQTNVPVEELLEDPIIEAE